MMGKIYSNKHFFSLTTCHGGTWGERRYSSYSFTTSALDGVVSVTPRPLFTPGERIPGTHCTGGWVGPRAGLDTEVRGKILCLCRGSNPNRPVVQPVVRHYTAELPRLLLLLLAHLFFTPKDLKQKTWFETRLLLYAQVSYTCYRVQNATVK